jgi:hypothetical protein
LPGFHRADDSGIAFDDHRHAAVGDIADGGCRSVRIRHRLQPDAGALLQEFASQMCEPADTRGCDGNFARLLFGALDQLRQRRDAECRRDGDEHRLIAGITYRHEVARQFDWEVWCDCRQRHKSRQRRMK